MKVGGGEVVTIINDGNDDDQIMRSGNGHRDDDGHDTAGGCGGGQQQQRESAVEVDISKHMQSLTLEGSAVGNAGDNALIACDARQGRRSRHGAQAPQPHAHGHGDEDAMDANVDTAGGINRTILSASSLSGSDDSDDRADHQRQPTSTATVTATPSAADIDISRAGMALARTTGWRTGGGGEVMAVTTVRTNGSTRQGTGSPVMVASVSGRPGGGVGRMAQTGGERGRGMMVGRAMSMSISPEQDARIRSRMNMIE